MTLSSSNQRKYSSQATHVYLTPLLTIINSLFALRGRLFYGWAIGFWGSASLTSLTSDGTHDSNPNRTAKSVETFNKILCIKSKTKGFCSHWSQYCCDWIRFCIQYKTKYQYLYRIITVLLINKISNICTHFAIRFQYCLLSFELSLILSTIPLELEGKSKV